MRTALSLLVEGEQQLGSYQIQVVRHSTNGWTITVPPLSALVTNRRLILWPQTRKPYPPASLPRHYVLRAEPIEIDRRSAVRIDIRTGHRLHFLVAYGQYDDFLNQVRRMLVPPMRGRTYRPVLSRPDLVRLIRLVEHL